MPRRDVCLSESYWPPDTSEELLELTLGGLLRQAAAAVPDRVALVEGLGEGESRRRWTYAELLADAERTARALLGRFAAGDAVAVYAANCPEWIVVQQALSLARILLVPLNPAYKAGEVEAILRSSGAVGIFHDDRYRDNDMGAIVATMRQQLPTLRVAHRLRELASFTGAADRDVELVDADPSDLVQIQYTSGTTGIPKGAVLHHRGVVNTSRYVALRAGFPPGGVWVNAMPMFHIAGTAVTEIGCLSGRGTYVIAPGFDPGALLELIESERANASLVVPTMIYALLDHPDFARRDLSSMRTILSGAADVPASLVRRVRDEMGCEFTILFGQTELNGVVCQTRLDDTAEDQSETLGQPLPHVEVKVADPVEGTVLPLGEPGEICARGYQTMAGYHDLPDATAATIRDDGWLHTGDLGTMDQRGYLRITGRLKDMIIRGGMNLFPREIENAIIEHPAVGQVSVIGVPDGRWGEVVGAVVLPRDGREPPSPEELNAFCRQRLSSHKSPRYWYFVDFYPLTPSGKVQKFKLAEWVRDGVIEPDPWAPSGVPE